MSTEVRNNTALERFEIYVDGALAGYTAYQDTASERAFVHAEVYPQHEAQGYGRILLRSALDSSRLEGFGILPLCPMVRHFVETNGEYVASVPQWARERLDLPQ